MRDYESTSWDSRKPDYVLFNGVKIKWKDIRGYFNEYYQSAVLIYNRFKRYGLPWAVGYQEIPEYLLTIYEVFDSTLELYQKAMNDRASKKR